MNVLSVLTHPKGVYLLRHFLNTVRKWPRSMRRLQCLCNLNIINLEPDGMYASHEPPSHHKSCGLWCFALSWHTIWVCMQASCWACIDEVSCARLTEVELTYTYLNSPYSYLGDYWVRPDSMWDDLACSYHSRVHFLGPGSVSHIEEAVTHMESIRNPSEVYPWSLVTEKLVRPCRVLLADISSRPD